MHQLDGLIAEVNRLRAEVVRLRQVNEELRGRLAHRIKEPTLFDTLEDNERIALKARIRDHIRRIDQTLGDHR